MTDVWEVPIVPAEWFRRHGTNVFPVHGKDPAVPKGTSWKGWRGPVGRDFGVELSDRLGVLDTDDRDDELWTLYQIAHGVIPETPFLVETARGFHRYYRLAGPLPKFIRRDGHIVEFKNVGQYVVGDGSVHPSGKKYTARPWSWRWEDIPFFPAAFVFDDGTCPPASSGGAGGSFRLAEVITEKERHVTLHKVMRALVAHGVPLEGAIAVCRMVNHERCHPRLADAALDKEVDSALGTFLTRAWKQKDRANFTRSPKTGWDLAGSLLEVGLSVEMTLVAVQSIDPAFDWGINDSEFDPSTFNPGTGE